MIVAAICLIAAALAQEPLPHFETTTVKSPTEQDRFIVLFNYPGGRIVMSQFTVAMLLHEALGVQRFQIAAGPAWIDSDRYMIEARPPASSKLSSFKPSNPEAPLVEEQRQMLLALLMDRFQLKFHRESRESPVYWLTKGAREPALQPTSNPDGKMFFAGLLGGGSGTVSAGNASMELIAAQLSRSIGAQVLDRTGLSGRYDFTLQHVYEPDEGDRTTIAERTVQRLGLKLERSRGPMEVIVIDHVEKPSPN